MAVYNFPSDEAGFTPGSSFSDTAPLNLGVLFALTTPISITGLRYYSPTSQSVNAQLWESGVKVAETVGFSATAGWNSIPFGAPYAGTTGVDYVASVLMTTGAAGYTVATSKFGSGGTPILVDVGPAFSNGASNGRYTYGSTIPLTNGTDSPWYGVDVVMDDGGSPDGTVVAVRATGSGSFILPVPSTGSGGSVTAVRATGSGLAQPVTVAGSSLVIGAQPMQGLGTMFGALSVSVTGGLVNGQVQAPRAVGLGRVIIPDSPGEGESVLSITQLRFRPRRPDGALAQGAAMTGGRIEAEPTGRSALPQGELMPIPFTVTFNGEAEIVKTVQANTLPTWAWKFTEYYPNGRSGWAKFETVRNVPPTGVTLDFERLDLVDPATLTTVQELTTAEELRLRQVEAAVSGGGGGSGSGYSTGILDSTIVGRAVLTAASQYDGRFAIDAAQASHSHTVSQITATGSPSASTYLRGDGTWQTLTGGGTVTWPVSGTPSTFPPSSHQHPSTDISDSTTIGRQVLTAADAAAILALLGGLSSDVETLPAGSVISVEGASTPRPTARTDIIVFWKAASVPTNSITGDVWLNGPDS
jgi:hypothetical protein